MDSHRPCYLCDGSGVIPAADGRGLRSCICCKGTGQQPDFAGFQPRPYLNPACRESGCDGTPCGHDGSPDACGHYRRPGKPAPAPILKLPSDVAEAIYTFRLEGFPLDADNIMHHISDLTRRLAEVEESHRVISKSNRAALHRMISAEARVRELEVQSCEALAGAHAEQEVSRHWKQEAEGLKSIVDAAGKLHREIAEALGRKDMPTDLLVLTAKGLRARVAEIETAEEECKAGWHLAGDAARGLRVECDGDLGHEAEQIRSERDALRERCEKLEKVTEETKRFLPLVNAVTAPHRHGQAMRKGALDNLSNGQIEVEAALAATEVPNA